MTSRFTELTVDCHDPERLAAFWCEVLDFKVIDRSEGKVEIGSWVPTVEAVRARQMPPTLMYSAVPGHLPDAAQVVLHTRNPEPSTRSRVNLGHGSSPSPWVSTPSSCRTARATSCSPAPCAARVCFQLAALAAPPVAVCGPTSLSSCVVSAVPGIIGSSRRSGRPGGPHR
ncbi:VOC family protein [Streptomyces humidus]